MQTLRLHRLLVAYGALAGSAALGLLVLVTPGRGWDVPLEVIRAIVMGLLLGYLVSKTSLAQSRALVATEHAFKRTVRRQQDAPVRHQQPTAHGLEHRGIPTVGLGGGLLLRDTRSSGDGDEREPGARQREQRRRQRSRDVRTDAGRPHGCDQHDRTRTEPGGGEIAPVANSSTA